MAKEVIKKDGTKEPFDAEKIKNAILSACQRTGLSEERKHEVIDQVTANVIQMAEEKDEISTDELKSKILAELDSIEPAVSDAWRIYEQEKKTV